MIRLTFFAAALAACTSQHGPQNDGPPPTMYPLNSVASTEYSVNITVGGSQAFDVIVDSGSTTLGIATAACTGCNVTPGYVPGSGAKDDGTTVQSEYLDGTGWAGEVFTDQVEVTGDSTAVPMKFAAISSSSGFFDADRPIEGILGFASGFIALPNTDSYIAQRMTAGLSPTFAVQMCPESGSLWFGGADKTHEVSDEQYTPLVPITMDQPFYNVTVNAVQLGGTDVGVSSQQFTMDTGTSVILLPTAAATAFADALNKDGGFNSTFIGQQVSAGAVGSGALKCMSTPKSKSDIDSALPSMSFTFPDASGTSFTVDAPATESYLTQIGQQWCFVVGEIDTSTDGTAILGDGFMHHFINVFDLENNQMGFAPGQNCTYPTVAHEPVPESYVPWIHGHPVTSAR